MSRTRPGTPGYQAAYDAAIGLQAVLALPATGHGWHTVNDLLDAYERSREFCRLAPRTRTDYLKGLLDVRARYGSAPLGIINSVALKGNVLDWIEVRWAGKGADRRLDPFKFALSWATGRHPERVPVNYLHGIPRFYEGADRAEIIWEEPRSTSSAARPPSCMRMRCGSRGRPACASATSSNSSAARSSGRRMAAARSSCARTSGGGAS